MKLNVALALWIVLLTISVRAVDPRVFVSLPHGSSAQEGRDLQVDFNYVGDSSDIVTVTYKLVSASATTADYKHQVPDREAGSSVQVTIGANSTSTTQRVLMKGDGVDECEESFVLKLESATYLDDGMGSSLDAHLTHREVRLSIIDANATTDFGGEENNVFSIPFKKNACGNDPVWHGVNLRKGMTPGDWFVESDMVGNYMTVGDMHTNQRIAPRADGRYYPGQNGVVRGWRSIPENSTNSLYDFGSLTDGVTLGFTVKKGSENTPKKHWCDRIDLEDPPKLQSVGQAVVNGNGADITVHLYDMEVSNWTWLKSGVSASKSNDLERVGPCVQVERLPCGANPSTDGSTGMTYRHLGGNDWEIELPLLEVAGLTNRLAFNADPECTWEFVSRAEETGKTPDVQYNRPRIDLKNIHNEWVYKCVK